MDKKIVINMLSNADKVEGQGVGSAYLEQVKLVREGAPELFDIQINSNKKSDIMHSHTIEPQNYLRMKKNKNAKVCYVHFLPDTLDGSIQLPKALFNVFKKYVVSFYRTADYLIVVNPTFMDQLEKYDIPREKMVYIPNYVSKEDFYEKPKEERSAIRKKYDIKEDAFVVIGVGQVQTRKGVLDFVNVAKSLPDIQFVWCGGFSFGKITDGYTELKEIVEHPPVNVKFLGIIPRTDMNAIYNIADVLFMPSYNELFPMSILEAVNLKRPLVLRDLDLYKDILFEKYQKGENNEDFKRLLQELQQDEFVYAKASKNSDDIAQYYAKENVLNIWKGFYTKIYNENVDGSLLEARKIEKQRRKQKKSK